MQNQSDHVYPQNICSLTNPGEIQAGSTDCSIKLRGKKKIKQGLKSPVWSDSLFWDFLGFGDPKLTEFQASTSSRSLNRGVTCTSDFVSQTLPTQPFLSAYGSSPWINHSSLTLGIENWFGDGVRTHSAQHQLHPSNSEALQLQHPLITAK